MDVTCTRCNTVYEIEEGSVSASGMTVKCTQCGHLFKVRGAAITRSDPPAPPTGSSTTASGGVTAKWRVRKPDGSVQALDSLAELSRSIVEGRFEESDEISGTGQAWKRLGDIAEFSVFFARERHSPAPRPVAAVLPRGDSSSVRQDAAREPGAAQLPPRPSTSLRARKNTPWPAPAPAEPELNVMGTPVTSDGAPLGTPSAGSSSSSGPGPARASAPGPAPRPARARTKTPMSSFGGLDPNEPPPGPPRPRSMTPSEVNALPLAPVLAPKLAPTPAAAPTTAGPAVLAPVIAPAPMPEPRKPSRSYLWIAISVPLVLAAGIGGAWVARKPWSAVPTHPAREFLLRGDEALAAHRLSRFDEAAREYTRALAFHADDAHILSSISRVHAVWSQLLRWRIATLQAEGASQSQIAALQAEAAQHAQLAKAHGERAAQRNPGNVEAEVALSDALRLTGNAVAARGELSRARQNEPVPSAETLRVAAWLAIDEAFGDMKAGLALAQDAVAREPSLIRARMLLIEILIAERELDDARKNVDAIRALAPDHPLLLDLSRAIDHASRVAATEPREREDSSPSPSTPIPNDSRTNAPPPRPKPDRDDSKVTIVSPEAAQELVRRGEHALEDGATRAAQQLFEEALALSPGSPAALTGLGYVALERGQTQAALRRFVPAARTGHGEALIGLGDTYRRIGRSEQALSSYQTYVRRFPRGSRRSIAERQIELLREQLAGQRSP